MNEVSTKNKKTKHTSKKMIVKKSAESVQSRMWNISHNIDEGIVFVYKNELVQGVIDKEQFGKYGLVHTVQEMYGPSAAGNLLSLLSRVLTAFLQVDISCCLGYT